VSFDDFVFRCFLKCHMVRFYMMTFGFTLR
jgi:hypothetical protein